MTTERELLKQAANWPNAGAEVTDDMLRIAIENAKRRDAVVERMKEVA